MSVLAPDLAALLPLLPGDRVGVVERIEPITLGLSGAGVYAVTASRGAYVLRVQSQRIEEALFSQQLHVLRRAAAAGLAPAIVHVDATARAVVSIRVQGVPIAAALGDPGQRERVFASVVDHLRTLHGLDPSGVAVRDPVSYTRAAWDAVRDRPNFPTWGASLGPALDTITSTLARDPRLVVSHNDVNPVNVLWDGTRAWLVDWDVTGLGHPYYDLATLALFLRFEDDFALRLVASHDGTPPDERARATFRALRKIAGLLSGLTFLGLVDDLGVRPAAALSEAPTLGAVYEGMRTGQLDLRSPRGLASMGLALLALGVGSEE